jgi:hypothetical protein
MIEIQDKVLDLVIFGFLFSERIYPVLEIENIHPNRVTSFRVNDLRRSILVYFFAPRPHAPKDTRPDPRKALSKARAMEPKLEVWLLRQALPKRRACCDQQALEELCHATVQILL